MAGLRSTLNDDETISSVDLAFGEFLLSQASVQTDGLMIAATLASAAVQQGDVCIGLARTINGPYGAHLPELDAWREQLQHSGVVQVPRDPVVLPLVLDGDRLYLARYWRDERALATALLERVADNRLALEPPDASALDRLFPPSTGADTGAPDWQRVAAVVATRHALCVITGGPGTGKTRTVARLLAVLQQQSGRSLDVALLAPTGKAAARLLASLSREAEALKMDGVVVSLPAEAATLHRELGYRYGQRGFHHNRDNPLAADLVLVDEASMIDLSLMAQLVDALRPDTRLILLGDRDQLASVEAGNVLGDIVGDTTAAHYSEAQRAALAGCCQSIAALPTAEPAGGMADAVVALKRSYRFDASSGIGQLAHAVNSGDIESVLASLGSEASDVVQTSPERIAAAAWVTERVLPHVRKVFAAEHVDSALNAQDALMVLCAVRKGPRGVESLTLSVERELAREGLMQPGDIWYRGRPILVTQNDPALDLYNGDTGIIWPNDKGDPMAWFAGGDAPRAIAPGRLPVHETCYAMTVHKTQGSEFDRVLLVLPEPPQPMLSRDLVYTAITRARHRVELYASDAALRAGCQQRRVRLSGLRERIWGLERALEASSPSSTEA